MNGGRYRKGGMMENDPDPMVNGSAEAYEAGAVLYVPGASAVVYRLLSGLVRLHAVDGEGEGVTLRYVKPGDWFGEEVLAGLPRSVFADAVTDVRVERFEVDELTAEQRDAIVVRMAVALDGLYRGMHRRATRRLTARVAAELLELRDSALASDEGGVRTVLMTHDALATSVGSVRETVTKVVGELVRLGAIDAGYGRIRLRDEAMLRRAADG
ncbi:MAG: helix-turn-helix domain-containing protein [Trueperaceae bacterium]|nr:helix-turn-helix domain-containing protein [Trueperaceae bacterium]